MSPTQQHPFVPGLWFAVIFV